jgi:hypothetical protein
LVLMPRLASHFIVALRERGPTVIHGRRPRSGRVWDRETDPKIRPRDHIPNTLITYITSAGAKKLIKPVRAARRNVRGGGSSVSLDDARGPAEE